VTPAGRAPRVSFVLPAHDECASLPTLLEEIREVARRMDWSHEIVVVDDGSDDGSEAWLREQVEKSRDLRALRLPRCHGQSTALARGLAASRGEVVVTLDADLQNVPADTPALVEALRDADLACGVRQGRRDTFAKRLGSRVANRALRSALGVDFRDTGCAHRAWRRPVVERIPRFEGFHRFVPVLAAAEGFRVVQLPVSHRPRSFGRTHYGNWRRALRGLYDLLGVGWLLRRRLDAPAQDIEIR
jgi:glycosyltransferase involved in cell wall biosynthesis